jgi:hypothetical protein
VPQRPRHGYAAGLPRGLLAGVNDRHQSRPLSRACAAARPRSTRLEPVLPLRGFTALVPHVHLPVLLAGPGPSGSADPSRRCRGCSHPPLRSRVGLPPASPACCDRLAAGPLHPCPIPSRLVAHVDADEAGLAVTPLAILLNPLRDGDPQVGHGDAIVGEADLGVLAADAFAELGDAVDFLRPAGDRQVCSRPAGRVPC